MPVIRCQRNGKAGYKWGSEGFCYIGKGGKVKAQRQGRAIEASKRSK
jgi:hypothetical protein